MVAQTGEETKPKVTIHFDGLVNAFQVRAHNVSTGRNLEKNILPGAGEVVWVGIRKELVIDNIPSNGYHGHLIKTLYRDGEKLVENTYTVGQIKRYVLSHIGSSIGFSSQNYDEKLKKAGL